MPLQWRCDGGGELLLQLVRAEVYCGTQAQALPFTPCPLPLLFLSCAQVLLNVLADEIHRAHQRCLLEDKCDPNRVRPASHTHTHTINACRRRTACWSVACPLCSARCFAGCRLASYIAWLVRPHFTPTRLHSVLHNFLEDCLLHASPALSILALLCLISPQPLLMLSSTPLPTVGGGGRRQKPYNVFEHVFHLLSPLSLPAEEDGHGV